MTDTLEDLLQLEKKLEFSSFDSEIGLEIALEIIRLIKHYHFDSVGIEVYFDEKVILHYLMKDRKVSPWLARKRKTVLMSQHSSFYVWYNRQEHSAYSNWLDDPTFGIAGGSFPLIVNHELKGAVTVSGLAQEDDHAIVVEALRNVKVKFNL